MELFKAMKSSASALTAERLRMDLIANNLANINTTKGPDGLPYRRRFAVQAERAAQFSEALQQAGDGVRIVQIEEDTAPFKLKHDPSHPDADEQGYVRLPNVDMLQEITDMMLANRIYQANVTAFNAAKAMAMRALEIGR